MLFENIKVLSILFVSSLAVLPGYALDDSRLKEGQRRVDSINSLLKNGSKNIRSLTLQRAEINMDMHKYREAIVDFSKAISIDPLKGGARVNYNLDQIYFDRARCYQSVADYPHAIADYDTILKLDDDSDEAYLFRGDCKAKLGKWEQALQDYNKCIKSTIDPTKTPYLARAKAYEKLGKPDLAKLDYEKAKALSQAGWRVGQ